MTGPIEDYLDQLRASLPTRPAETSRILAEAQGHLRESVAAGLHAGLTEAEAQQAAISAFGSVRAVVRAHQTGRARAAAVLGGCALTSSKLAGLFLLAFSVSSLALLADVKMSMHNAAVGPLSGPVLQHLAAGIAGLLLLVGCHLACRSRRRGARAVAASAVRYFPLAAVSLFGAGTAALVLLKVSGAAHIGGPPILASLALAVGYAVRMRWRLRPRGTTA
jgi:hypothetical protein